MLLVDQCWRGQLTDSRGGVGSKTKWTKFQLVLAYDPAVVSVSRDCFVDDHTSVGVEHG